jgi:hypothetical protein
MRLAKAHDLRLHRLRQLQRRRLGTCALVDQSGDAFTQARNGTSPARACSRAACQVGKLAGVSPRS